MHPLVVYYPFFCLSSASLPHFSRYISYFQKRTLGFVCWSFRVYPLRTSFANVLEISAIAPSLFRSFDKRFASAITSDIVLTILYGISLSKVIDLPIQAYTVAYYVFGVLFVIFFLIPSIIQTIERTRLFLLMFKQWSCPRYNTKQPLRLLSRVVVFYYFRRIASNFRSTNTLL